MRRVYAYLITFVMFSPFFARANDIVVSAATLTGQDVTAGLNNLANFTMVRFDLNWSNSWRVSSGPSNWDAAWIFVKYRIEGGTGCTPGGWQHATLSASNGDHSVTSDNGTAAAFSTTADGKGVFIHRAGDGTGAINWDQVMLRWNYGADLVNDACNVSVKVFAVESVYIPQGSFYAGDGASNNGQFESGVSGTPFQITSEAGFNLGGGGAGSMGNNNRTGQTAPVDEFTDAISVALPGAFPKGFQAIYTMKYEVSQEQYVEFLNTLTSTQQLARHGATATNRFFPSSVAPTGRNGVKCTVLPVGATPGIYANDLNNNGVVNEAADGQNIAMQHTSTQDILSYLDWAALRPMTELELEKIGRGTLPAVLNEYAWGSAALYATAYGPLINAGTGSEVPTSPSATLGNAHYSTTGAGIGGPVRVGIFATSTSSRVVAGASYYGVMEITGNVWEDVVGVGGASGRSFTGLHGNGAITAAGFADVDFWPGSNGNTTFANAQTTPNNGSTGHAGMMFRCGSWTEANYMRLSDRSYPGFTSMNTRDQRMGCRGVRTAP